MLIIDQVATAPCTDPIQVRALIKIQKETSTNHEAK